MINSVFMKKGEKVKIQKNEIFLSFVGQVKYRWAEGRFYAFPLNVPLS